MKILRKNMGVGLYVTPTKGMRESLFEISRYDTSTQEFTVLDLYNKGRTQFTIEMLQEFFNPYWLQRGDVLHRPEKSENPFRIEKIETGGGFVTARIHYLKTAVETTVQIESLVSFNMVP